MNYPSDRIIKVAIIGPECTGKSTLSEYLAQHYNTCWVQEYARTYLDKLNRPYKETDLLKIAHEQIQAEDEGLAQANKILICDTNLLVIKVWSDFKFGRCSEEILNLMRSRTYDLHLLTYIDVPWQEDPLREHPDKREALWKIYKQELEKQNLFFVDVKGERDKRRKIAVEAIDNLKNLK